MRLLCTGDWHITNKTPKNRIDNYPQTILTKLKYILDYAAENKIFYILQPGDFFDSVKVPHSTVASIAKLLAQYEDTHLIACFGQHDLQFHNAENPNTPLNVLLKAGLVFTAPLMLPIGHRHYVHFAGWGNDIPEPTEDGYNILLTHRMVIHENKLWEAQTGYEESHTLLKSTKFDLITCGDNHTGFVHTHDDRILTNCGSLMRSSTSQSSHTPFFVVVNTDTNLYHVEYIPVEDINDVMDFSQKEKEEQVNQNLTKFISNLTSTKRPELNYKKNLYNLINSNSIDKGIVDIIDEVMGD